MKVKGWESSLVFFFLSINCLVVMYHVVATATTTTTSLFVCYILFTVWVSLFYTTLETAESNACVTHLSNHCLFYFWLPLNDNYWCGGGGCRFSSPQTIRSTVFISIIIIISLSLSFLTPLSWLLLHRTSGMHKQNFGSHTHMLPDRTISTVQLVFQSNGWSLISWPLYLFVWYQGGCWDNGRA